MHIPVGSGGPQAKDPGQQLYMYVRPGARVREGARAPRRPREVPKIRTATRGPGARKPWAPGGQRIYTVMWGTGARTVKTSGVQQEAFWPNLAPASPGSTQGIDCRIPE